MHKFVPFKVAFTGSEAVISQGGAFLPATAYDWTPVSVTNGVAHSSQTRNEYDDSYAIFAGDWGQDYEISGTVYRNPALNESATHEIELNVCAIQTDTNIRLIECLFAHHGAIEMYSWAAGYPMNDTARFGYLNSATLGRPIENGEILKVRKVGNTLTAYVSDQQIVQATNLPFVDGSPAISFFTRPQGGSNALHFGLTDVTVKRIPTSYSIRGRGAVPPGTYQFSFTIPSQLTELWVRCPRVSGWLNNTTTQLRLKLEYSLDGGVTWPRGYEVRTDGIPSQRGYDPGIMLDFTNFGSPQNVMVRGEIQTYRNLQTGIELDVL